MRILYVHGWYIKQPMHLLFIWCGTLIVNMEWYSVQFIPGQAYFSSYSFCKRDVDYAILLYSRNSGVRIFGLNFLTTVVRPFVCKIIHFSFFIDCSLSDF